MPSPIRSVVATTLDPPPAQRALVRLPFLEPRPRFAAAPFLEPRRRFAAALHYPTRSEAESVALDGGLLALVVTDLEGFTTLVERLGDLEARALMQVHNRIVRAALLEHAGREVAHTGDGIMAAFRSVAAALQAAIEIQRALEAHTRAQPAAPLRARIGVHAGEPLPEEGRLFGTCVNTAVRVCEASGATRVLVSDLARQLAAGCAFRFAPGEPVALRGLAHPMDVHELLWQTLPTLDARD